MKEITILGTLYGIEPDCYNGDIVLISTKQDVVIPGGYSDLKLDAQVEHGYVDDITGEIECEKHDIEAYIENHIEDYIIKNFGYGVVTQHEQAA